MFYFGSIVLKSRHDQNQVMSSILNQKKKKKRRGGGGKGEDERGRGKKGRGKGSLLKSCPSQY